MTPKVGDKVRNKKDISIKGILATIETDGFINKQNQTNEPIGRVWVENHPSLDPDKLHWDWLCNWEIL